ncbi:MAG: YncE family protein [Chitinophagales bacterium]
MIFNNTTSRLFFLILSIFFNACEEPPTPDPEPINKGYEKGVFVCNEGAFMTGTGTISFLGKDTTAMEQNVFRNNNGSAVLGNIVQSISYHNDRYYVVVNNAAKVMVVDATTFEYIGEINGFTFPRYFLGINEQKAYVSQWGDGGVNGSIAVVDLITFSITKTISTGKGAEKMQLINEQVFVACEGGFDTDNVVSVVNTNMDELLTNITVGDNPNSLQVDNAGNLWVLCAGKTLYNGANTPEEATLGSLVKINPISNTVIQTYPFDELGESGGFGINSLLVDEAGEMLYYYFNTGIYQSSTDNPANRQSVVERSAYGIGFDKTTDLFYLADAKDFVSNGWVIRYELSGAAVDSFQVGLIPNGSFLFQY